jgi:hypothetical protein
MHLDSVDLRRNRLERWLSGRGQFDTVRRSELSRSVDGFGAQRFLLTVHSADGAEGGSILRRLPRDATF